MKKSIIVSMFCLMTFMALAQSVNTYVYDQQDQLTRTTYTNGTVTQYTYDALGRRTKKQTNGVSVNCIISVASYPSNGGTVSGSGTYLGGDTCSLTATANSGCTFLYWTERGSVVSSDTTYSFMVTTDRNLVANFKVSNGTGALNGVFSVSDSTFVVFSQGNLQYQPSTATWRFADNQYDRIGIGGNYGNVSPTYDGWMDYFGWGTSGYNHGAVCYMPWSTSDNPEDYYAYGCGECNLNDQTGQADWGYNAISNGGNTVNTWRTLTKDEWDYLLNNRNTSSGIRFTQGRVNGVRGVILLPDNWDNSIFTFNYPNGGYYDRTLITREQWIVLEQHGAVFLPVNNYASYGFYWSATSLNEYAYCFWFNGGQYAIRNDNYRNSVSFVRLVRSPEVYSYEINATPYPMEGGTVVGGGIYQGGNAITLNAIPNEGYYFLNWTENGKVVSTAATDCFYVNGKRTLVANFSQVGGTGVLKGVFSVGENSWVNFSQGNLQYQASSNTWRFATNQYDIIGEGNKNISPTYTGWIDLFGWGTSGYNHGAECYQPWSTSVSNSDYYAYGDIQYHLYDQTGMADWGYNAISNGGNTLNTWRTLTNSEWRYLIIQRNTPSGIRYAKAQVNEVNGLILLPDDWSDSYFSLNQPNDDDAQCSSNILTAAEWTVLEVHGAVFLPAAGYREGTTLYSLGSKGIYSSSKGDHYGLNGNTYVVNYGLTIGYYLYYSSSIDRFTGSSVRLVCPAQNKTFCINAAANSSEYGTVIYADSTSVYHYGETATFVAEANEGYAFLNWSSNGEVVGCTATYSFTVTDDIDLVAVFDAIHGIVVGSGEATSNYLPSNNYYKYSLTQQIYTAEEFGSEGVITSIAFYNGGAEKTRIYDFYMKSTEKASFSNNTDWEVVSEADKVFSGEVTMTAGYWTEINLTNPFIYDGISNVVLVTDDNTGAYTDSPDMACRVFDASSQAIRASSDYTNYDPFAPSNYSGTRKTMKNQLMFVKEPISDCMRSTHLTATEIGPDFVKLSWNEHGTSEQWYVEYGGDPVIANTNDGFILQGLEPETTYTISVRPDCDESMLSHPIIITTLKACQAPQEVEVGNITGKTATVTWNGYSNGYNVMYRSAAYIDGIEETESFDATSAPNGWTCYYGTLNDNGTGLSQTSIGWSFGTNQFSSSHAYMNIYSTNKYGLVTPSISVSNNSALSFDVAYTKYNSTEAPQTNGTDDRFLVLISTDEKVHWTILREWNNSGSRYVLNNLPVTFQPVDVIDLSAYTGQTVYIAFYGASTESNADNTLRIDNVSIGHFVAAGAWQIGTVEDSPYNLTGLSPETLYEVKVQGDCGSEGLSDETEIVTFWTLEACPAPSNVSVTNIGSNIATVNWTGDSESYTVSYREANTFKEDFESETSFADWTFVSMNAANAIGTTYGAGRLAAAAHNGSYGFRFSSYTRAQDPETYDQYLISPELTATGELKFYFMKTNNSSTENLFVGYSTTTNDLEAFTWSNDLVPTQDWQDYTQELPADVKYIAFHYFGNYAYYVYVDDITVGACETPESDWQTVTITNGATTVNLTGLTPSTNYEVSVQGLCDGFETNWSEMASFTTIEATTVTQTIELVEGWNWFSTYIELDDPIELLQMLENGMGDSGVQIEQVIDGVDMNAGDMWAGDLMFIGLMNEHTYMIEVTEDVTVELQGPTTDPADHPITIYPNDYSWIGYPCSEEVDVNVALAGFEAEDGDMIETVYGEDGGVIYYYDGVWVGDFDTMIPGRGYIYFSNSDEEKTLVFQAGEGAKAKVKK